MLLFYCCIESRYIMVLKVFVFIAFAYGVVLYNIFKTSEEIETLRTKNALALIIACLVATTTLLAAPQVQATPTVTVRFTATGFTNYNSYIMTINGTDWTLSRHIGLENIPCTPRRHLYCVSLPENNNL